MKKKWKRRWKKKIIIGAVNLKIKELEREREGVCYNEASKCALCNVFNSRQQKALDKA